MNAFFDFEYPGRHDSVVPYVETFSQLLSTTGGVSGASV